MHLIAQYIRPYLKRTVIGVIIKLLGTVVELFLPYILAYIIDSVTPKGDMRSVFMWGGVMLLCTLLAWIFNVIANRSASAVGRDVTERLRHDLFEKIMFLTNRQIDWFSIPSLISRMTTDTYNIHRTVGMMLRMGIRAPILLIGGLVVTLVLDPVLAGVLALMIPIMTVIVYGISKKSLPMFSAVQRAMDEMVRVVRENAAGVRVIKALSRTEYERERFGGANSGVAKAELRANMTMGLSRPVMNFMLNTGLVLVIIVGAYRINLGLAEPGVIVAFLIFFTMMLNVILGITRILTMYSSALASAERIDEVLRSPGELDVLPAKGENGEYHVEMRNVSFSYIGKEDNLRNISFALKRGESLGIIGPTGAGKSTLAGLLMRYYDVGQGSVLIDGRDVRAMSQGELRKRFGVVFQNDAVFRGTIESNIKLGREISMDSVEKAIATARAQDYIEAAGGISHGVDIHGANLSGGQRQRLLIARALAGNPEILILDDSSSALDYMTDAMLRQGLREGFGKSTSIIIAQRVSSIKHCSQIMVLEDGEVMGLGTHSELMESCQVYREIAHLQMGEGTADNTAEGGI